jgi:hypothetical protein
MLTSPVDLEDSVRTPVAPSPERLRDFYFGATERLTLGLLKYRDHSFRFGPLELVRFGAPARTPDGWSFPIRGGALVAEPGGELRIGTRDGVTQVAVRGYRQALPLPLYRVTQRLFHHFQTRLVLLRLRGRVPAEAPPATPAARLLAGAIDAGLCLALARGRPGRALLFAAPYLVAGWSIFGGLTLGGLLVRQRVTSVDGSAVTPGQALLRLALLPAALLRFRAVHDEVAGTDVVRP